MIRSLKRSILNYFKLDANAYLNAFKKERRTGNETYKMWANRLRDLQSYKLATFRRVG